MANKVNFDTAQKLDITCRRGDSFSLTLTIKNSNGDLQNLTSDQFAMQVRDKANSDGLTGLILSTDPSQSNEYNDATGTGPALDSPVDISFNDPTPQKLTLDRGTSATSGADYGTLTITAAADAMRKVPSGRYVYDLQRYDNTNATHKTLVTGSFTIKEDITEAKVSTE